MDDDEGDTGNSADAATINITLNSFGTKLNDLAYRSDRADLYPSFGKLYMHGVACCRAGDPQKSHADIVNCASFPELVRSTTTSRVRMC